MIKCKWFIVEGFLLLILGSFALARPAIAAEALVELVGWLLLVMGIVALVGGLTTQSGPRAPASIAGGIIGVIFGLLFLLMPVPALSTITVLIAFFFMISGFVEISSSCALRSSGGHSNHWGLAFFNGLIGILLGILLLSLWPDSYEVIGFLLGLNFLMSGAYLVSLGWFFRNAPTH